MHVNQIIGVSDAKTSNRREDVLVTHALGSCIGVALYDAAVGVGGLLHFQLPSSKADPARSVERPLMYADTGMVFLLEAMARLGAQKHRMSVWLAGGANLIDDQRLFDIGRRNHTAIRKVLWTHGMFIGREKVGGSDPITMELHMSTGEALLRCRKPAIAA